MPRRRGNKEGTILPRKDGRWMSQISLPDGKRKTFYGVTRKEVEKKLRDAQNDLEKGIVPADERQTIEQFLTYWLASVEHEVEPSTYRIYDVHVRRFVKEFGKVTLAKLSPQQVQVFYAKKIKEGLAPTTTNRMHATMKQAMRDAIRLGLVPRNIFELVKPPRYEPEPKQILTEDQARQLLRAAKGERLEALYVLVLATGMREGELFALQWQDVDFDGCVLSVHHGVQKTSQGYRMHEPKTRTSKRSIALAPHVVQALQAHQQRQAQERELLGDEWDETYKLVFPNSFGRLMSPHRFTTKLFPRIVQKAGIPEIHFHDLRHTAATLLLKRGVHVKVVSEMLGHASISITLSIYTHVLPTMQRDAADMTSRMFGGMEDIL